MRAASCFAVAVVLLASLSLHAGDDAAKAKELVLKAIKASGADKGADKPYAETWKDKGTFNFMGQTFEYTANWIFQAPDKYRFEMQMNVTGNKVDIKVGLDGVKAFESALGMQRGIDGEKLDYVKTEAYQFWLLSLNPLVADKEFKLKTLGEKKVGARDTVGVQVDRAGKPTAKLYFAKDTGLLHKLEITVKNEFDGWKDALDEVYLDNYQDVDGRKMFAKLRVDRAGQVLLDATISEARRVPPVDVKKFQEP